MAIIIGAVSQKGGVGKSTIARLVAREFAAQDWAVKIADLALRFAAWAIAREKLPRPATTCRQRAMRCSQASCRKRRRTARPATRAGR